MKGNKAYMFFLIGGIVVLLWTVALIPLNLFVLNFPAWVVVLCGVMGIALIAVYLIVRRSRIIIKIILPVISVLTVAASSVVAFAIPYWNSCAFKSYSGKILGYDDTLTYEQASDDLDEVVSLLCRIHPMFRGGLTDEVRARYGQSKEHLGAMPQITVNDLRREIQWMINPMRDAHTTTYNNYPNDRYLKDVPSKQNDGYSVLSINGIDRGQIRELAKPYYSYESEEWISVDVGSLASLDFYGFEQPYTYIWEDDKGNRVTEVYSESDFVGLQEYVDIRDSYADDAQTDGKPFVYYDIDEDKSLAVLTLTECNNNKYYSDCVREMFTKVKELNIRNVAVDLRGNGGGNSGVANEFVRYLPVEEYEDCSSDWRWNFFTFHDDAKLRNNPYSELTFNGSIYILTDRRSFSSAMLFSLIIQDNGLGYVVGESPANNVNAYGDVTCFCLKESGLFIQISTKKWYRIDRSNPNDYVIPDFPCDGGDVSETLYEIIGE